MKSCGVCSAFDMSCNNCKAEPANRATLSMLGIKPTVYVAPPFPSNPNKMLDIDELQSRGYFVRIRRTKKNGKANYHATIKMPDKEEQIVFICTNLDKIIDDVKHYCRKNK